jgi:hypothetical protein
MRLGLAALLGAGALQAQDSTRRVSAAPFYLGAATAYLIHEAGHIGASLVMGYHPTIGVNAARPVVYSGIDATREPHKQFWFSSMGLNVQNVLDELILDIPHAGGGSFERGVLVGDLATTAFYLTIGRTGSVSDIAYMARVHGMTKTQSTLLYGTVAGVHVWRILRRPEYAHFFALPTARGAAFVVQLRR